MLPEGVRKLASELGDDPNLRKSSSWRPQYRTTNSVHVSDLYVIKQYRSRAKFKAEQYFYSRRTSLSFRTPSPLIFVELPDCEPIAISPRVAGRTLLSLISTGHELPAHLVDTLIDDLIEFECLPDFLENDLELWSYGLSVSSLCQRLREVGSEAIAALLAAVAATADEITAALPRVPCFDLYPGNIILADPEQRGIVTHVDFDKIRRAVPAGEQLSHIALVPELRNALDRLLPKYAAAIGLDEVDLVVNLRLATFFRACAGLRDSVMETGGDEAENAYREQRSKTRSQMLELMKAALAEISLPLGLSEIEVSEIMRALGGL